MIHVYYFNFGYQFTETLSRGQAIKMISEHSYYKKKELDKLSDKAINKLAQKCYTGYY